jgi:hypothetical protein
MTEYLKLVKENAYMKFCIILLIQELDKHKELKGIQNYLKDVIDDVEENTTKKNLDRFFEMLKKEDD